MTRTILAILAVLALSGCATAPNAAVTECRAPNCPCARITNGNCEPWDQCLEGDVTLKENAK